MITRIQGYNINNAYRPAFGAVIRKDAAISIKRRGENLYVETPINKFFKWLKEAFFETFPKLDSEYKELKYNVFNIVF